MIEFNYPIWYVVICIVLAITYAFLFYWREKSFTGIAKWLVYGMGIIRFLVAMVLALLLLEPIIQNEKQKIEKPIVVIAQDNSESILSNKDSSYYTTKYAEELKQLISTISENYEVHSYSFGSSVSEDISFAFSDKQSDFSILFDALYAKYYGRNLGAIILASDGIINRGQNPLYAKNQLKETSIFTIALGDTSVRKDIQIDEVNHNDIAFLGNDFPVRVTVSSHYYKDRTTNVIISKNGKTIATKKIAFDDEDDYITLEFQLSTSSKGKQKYRIEVSALEDEFTLVNNSQEFFVEVLDNKQKVLIIAASPHPDIASIRTAIEKNINYKVDVTRSSKFSAEIKEYDLIIFHQVPSTTNTNDLKLVKLAQSAKIPALYIVGQQTNFAQYNALKTGLSITGPNGIADARPSINSSFASFTLEQSIKDLIPELPPLQIPFAGDYKTVNSSNVLLYQKIGATTTTYPLLLFNESNDQRVGVFLGEGIWRWKFQNFIKSGNTQSFDDFISKIVQFLAQKVNKSKFRVTVKNQNFENETILFNAELYNDIYELVNEPEAVLEIVNDKGAAYPVKSFSKFGETYRLDAGTMDPGTYTYSASVNYNGKNHKIVGEFIIEELKVEYNNVVADHALLFNLADESGGTMIYPNQMEALIEALNTNENIVPVSYINEEVTDLIKWKWVFALLLGLLSLEWFLRKRNGAY